MVIRGTDLIRAMEAWAPPSLAVEKDRIGLQVGDPRQKVRGVLCTLDVTEGVVEEAVQSGANWIIAHHAVIFNPVQTLRTDQPKGRLYAKLIKHDINVFVAHTNLDTAVDGVNDVLCEKLGIHNTRVMMPITEDQLKKLVVFIPRSHHEQVLQAISEAGAGWIGNYSHCTFNLEGIGTFMPREGTNPYIGKQGALERVEEVRLETVVPQRLQQQVVQAMLDAHPYEEPAYDIYPLELEGIPHGLGRVGELPREMTLKELAEKMKEAYRIPRLRMVGDPAARVKKAAVLGGSGGRYYPTAKKMGADVYITGDVDFHIAQDAMADGICLLDPGHHVEHLVLERVADKMREKLKDVPVVVSRTDTNPFQFI
ncbi:GTP cyclohydrolase 1 type 2 [Marinithermofilum abyssi]|uniref:GTP cyclohydrolase 1 type 2 homolog n=1 Tax=Marinithermofilum abyssi TaxID=1571185 RepID=A0A8J2VCT0_9BACL|nr:Nif3-like dinuclear metal center hexameric protein [Marinithermofilum abyssi]GGE14827.1 GTP cyclohydrolase 1 type 2 [Marinithermofilum abyssi]